MADDRSYQKLWNIAWNWAQENVKNYQEYSTTQVRARVQEAFIAGAGIPANTMNCPVRCQCGWRGTLWQLIYINSLGDSKGCPDCYAPFLDMIN